ncbi:hypothetical protein ACIHIX_42895 [Streptomyces sp. NPDC051913]|uniref:hypothetical protein n=1 Tax=Streptomyces sp. NPDC051913 TaxID=3365676 RepID=UPI0037D7AA6A
MDEAPQAVLSRHGSARSIAGPTGSGRSERPAAPSHRTVGDPPSGRPGDPTDARHPPPGRSGDGRQERGARNPGPRLAPCGTRAAYQRHLRRGEFVDEACRDANARGAGRYRRTGSTRDRTDETRPRAAARAATADTPS